MPRKERDRFESLDDLYGFLDQSNISVKNKARLRTLAAHENQEVAELAALILEIAHVHPGKRKRWLKLARHHRPLFDRLVELFGLEWFEDLLAGNGDFESPLWRILQEYRIAPPWTARACDCGSGRSFRDCCLERENHFADHAMQNRFSEETHCESVDEAYYNNLKNLRTPSQLLYNFSVENIRQNSGCEAQASTSQANRSSPLNNPVTNRAQSAVESTSNASSLPLPSCGTNSFVV
jgi:hypothetical protein